MFDSLTLSILWLKSFRNSEFDFGFLHETQKSRTLFFCRVLRKFSEITSSKPIFSQCNIFYNYDFFFFQSAFWPLFNHRQRSQSNQEQCSPCCNSPCFFVLLCTHCRLLQCISTNFRELKESGVLWSIFPDYVISCAYGTVDQKATICLPPWRNCEIYWSIASYYR